MDTPHSSNRLEAKSGHLQRQPADVTLVGAHAEIGRDPRRLHGGEYMFQQLLLQPVVRLQCVCRGYRGDTQSAEIAFALVQREHAGVLNPMT